MTYPESLTHYDEVVMYDQPYAFWRCDEANGTVVQAVNAPTHVGALNGGYVLGGEGPVKNSGAFDLNGSTGYVSVATATGFPTTGAVTIEAWIKPDTHGANRGIFGYGDYSTNLGTSALRIGFSSPNFKLAWYWWGGGANDLEVNLAGGTLALAWHHIAATYDGIIRKLYVDGVLVGSDFPPTPTWILSNLAIGRTWAGGSEYLDGQISRVAFYKRALTAEEVLYHYQIARDKRPPNLSEVLRGERVSPVWNFRYYRTDDEGLILSEITDLVESGTISMSTDRPIKRQLSMRMLDDPMRDFSDIAENIVVEAEVHAEDGQIFTMPCGLYHVTFPRKEHSSTRNSLDITAYDRSIHMQDRTITDTYVMEKGSDVFDHINVLLADMGITKVNITPRPATVVQTIGWEVGTSYLQILTDLFAMVSYYAPWFDSNNYFTSRPYDDLGKASADVRYATDEDSMVMSPFNVEVNSDRFANQVIVVSDDPQNPLTATVTNNDPSSLVSVDVLGFTKSKVIRATIADAAAATARATFELQRASAIYKKGRLLTTPDPRRDVNEIYELEVFRTTPFTYEEQILSYNPVLFWRLGDASGNFNDYSGRGNHGTLVGPSDVIRNVKGAVLEDDGAIQIYTPDTTIQKVNAGPFNGSRYWDDFWCWIDAPPSANTIVLSICWPSVPSTPYGRRYYIDTNLNLLAEFYNGTSISPMAITNNISVPLKRWFHVVGVFVLPQHRVYLDGSVVAIRNSVPNVFFTSGDVILGPLADAHAHIQVDEVAIYNKATRIFFAEAEQREMDVRRAAVEGSGLVASGKWWSMGWSMPLEPGAQMTHDVARVESFA